MNKEDLLQRLKKKETTRHTLKYTCTLLSLVQLGVIFCFEDMRLETINRFKNTALNHNLINAYIDFQIDYRIFLFSFFAMVILSALLWVGSIHNKTLIHLLEENTN